MYDAAFCFFLDFRVCFVSYGYARRRADAVAYSGTLLLLLLPQLLHTSYSINIECCRLTDLIKKLSQGGLELTLASPPHVCCVVYLSIMYFEVSCSCYALTLSGNQSCAPVLI